MTQMEPRVAERWEEFLATQRDSDAVRERFYEAFSIGDSKESRDLGARLVATGEKTATSDLQWSYDASDADPPADGAVSILLDGDGEPVCVVESTHVETVPFDQVGARFAANYGEWGGTLDSWREQAWAYYSAVCRRLDREPSETMPLVCERLHVLHLFDSTG